MLVSLEKTESGAGVVQQHSWSYSLTGIFLSRLRAARVGMRSRRRQALETKESPVARSLATWCHLRDQEASELELRQRDVALSRDHGNIESQFTVAH